MKVYPFRIPHFWRKTSASQERGAAMVELAIVAPAFLFLAICSFDVARAMRNHMMLTQIAREAARVVSRYPYLEEGAFSFQVPAGGATPIIKMNMPPLGAPGCTPAPKYCCGGVAVATTAQLAQKNFMSAIRDLARYHRLELNYKSGSLCVRSEYSAASVPDQVSVYISMEYASLFRLFDGIRIRVQSSGTYI